MRHFWCDLALFLTFGHLVPQFYPLPFECLSPLAGMLAVGPGGRYGLEATRLGLEGVLVDLIFKVVVLEDGLEVVL